MPYLELLPSLAHPNFVVKRSSGESAFSSPQSHGHIAET